MKLLKKVFIFTLTFLLVLTGCTSSTKDNNKDIQASFDEFIEQDFVATMEDNYLNTHIFLEHPENFGVDIKKLEVTIDSLPTDDYYNQISKEINDTKKEFDKFNREELTNQQKDTYDIAKYLLDISIDSTEEKYRYLNCYFKSISGIHTQLPILFADLTLRNENDVVNLVKLIKSVEPYINTILEYTKKQSELGTLMIDFDNVIEYCQNIKDTGENSSTLSSINSNIEALNLGTEKNNQYFKEVKEAFNSSYLVAYDNIISTMNSLKSTANNTRGLTYLKNGKEYYEILFRSALGTDKSIKEIQSELTSTAQSTMLAISKIAINSPSLYEQYYNDPPTTSYNDFESIMSYLNESVKEDFPPINEIDYQIKPLSKDLANSSVAAYFNLPALDSSTPKQIRVNTQNDNLKINSLETFSTVAHEGLPGHMYQTSYSYENLPNNWRKVVPSFLGYTEGYANYVEHYSLKYLKEIDSQLIDLHQNLSIYSQTIYALMDIGIHYNGWSTDETADFMEKMGLDSSSVNVIYSQLQNNPTSYLSYYVGYVQFANLKTKAQSELKDNFNDKAFHEAILKSGAAPFAIVERNVDAYIDANK